MRKEKMHFRSINMRYDIIIIGAGLGGMTAGAKLAREGKKVLLIEQHTKPGGCATTFKRGEFTLEVGLHEMDGPSPRDMKTRIFNELDVFNNVEFIRIPEFYRFITDRFSITIPHDPELAINRLSEIFPQETIGIKAYFDQILSPKKKLTEASNQDKSLGEFLDSIITDEKLKLVLLGNLGYFHDDPYSLSLAYYSVAQGSYFTGGASFIKGGSQKLSDHLISYIRRHGGDVFLNHIVTGIQTHDNKISEVYFKKRNNFIEKKAIGDEIVANNAIPNLADLLPGETGLELKNELRDLKTGASLLTVYFGFSKPLKELGHSFYSTFVFDGSVKSQADILRNNRDDFTRRSFTFVDYSQIDSGLAPEGKSVGALCCIDYLTDWEGISRKEYKDKKEVAASTFIERLEEMIPGISRIIEYYEVATPATVKRYTLNPGGAVYGFAQTPSRKAFNSFKPLTNLHFASAWGKTGGGFSGAIYSGFLCAYSILRKKSTHL
ncbi:MAG TPA: NAD(P)/FAD-dependent oxidoreductase [Bacteroidales bacterium]|nr:NAD(P)/FAD-dependent oxidoreductase [Bacteroidales bacterium]